MLMTVHRCALSRLDAVAKAGPSQQMCKWPYDMGSPAGRRPQTAARHILSAPSARQTGPVPAAPAHNLSCSDHASGMHLLRLSQAQLYELINFPAVLGKASPHTHVWQQHRPLSCCACPIQQARSKPHNDTAPFHPVRAEQAQHVSVARWAAHVAHASHAPCPECARTAPLRSCGHRAPERFWQGPAWPAAAPTAAGSRPCPRTPPRPPSPSLRTQETWHSAMQCCMLAVLGALVRLLLHAARSS